MGKRVRGSIRRLPSGRWQVRYTGLDGIRRTLEQTHRTKAEAEAAYAVVAADMATGRWVDPSLAGVTFGTYAARWVAERATISPDSCHLRADGELSRRLCWSGACAGAR